ncbi:hypothetical protein HELRODRAFT_62145, partial [Helobdella robusta]|uniref:C2 domain-containing protein n=1 Tax=Helobdella robusta TaxID=6412 RepID=T1FWW3_HELRO
QIQMSYDDFDNSLNVRVIRAKNIQPVRKSNVVDAFVKISLLPITNYLIFLAILSPQDCRKTKPVEKTLNPEWDRLFVFLGVDRMQLMERAVEVSLWDHDKFLPNTFIGEVVIDFNGKFILC